MDKHMPDAVVSVSAGIDTIQAKLEQARAILFLLLNDGGSGRFDSDHDTVMSAMWSALDLITSARDCSEQAMKAYVAEHWPRTPPAIPSQQ